LLEAKDLTNSVSTYFSNITDEKTDEMEESVELPHMSFSKTDESSLLKLMTESSYASAATDEFVKKLQLELTNLETVIHLLCLSIICVSFFSKVRYDRPIGLN
jgi:hypothetical protein